MNAKMILVALVALMLAAGTATAGEIELKDPSGDDKGHGKLVYPTDKAYKKGSFDLVAVTIDADGGDVEVTVEFNAKVEDPWDSNSWGGNGFSLQFVQLYIDQDHKAGSGHAGALPGMNVDFVETARWEKVLIISPQPNSRLKSEIGQKAKAQGKDVVLPKKVKVRGKKIVATFKAKDVGKWAQGWGVQALVQSNEGYPTKDDLLSRKVNEYEGEHRFGGGNDYDCDSHVIDMLAGKAAGDAAEAKAQYKALAGFSCDASGKGARAKIDMVYPQ
jgi:carbohydrate-binding DOMON domain-containing protein